MSLLLIMQNPLFIIKMEKRKFAFLLALLLQILHTFKAEEICIDTFSFYYDQDYLEEVEGPITINYDVNNDTSMIITLYYTIQSSEGCS